MIYRFLLEIVIAAHFAFILFVIFGGLLGLRWKWTAFLHLPAFFYGFLNELLNIKCPLALFENRLREQSENLGYNVGFVEPFLRTLIYPPVWTQEFGNFLAALLLSFNLLVYALIWQKWRRLTRLN